MKVSQLKNIKLVEDSSDHDIYAGGYVSNPTLLTTEVVKYTDYRDPCGYDGIRLHRQFMESDDQLKEEHFLKRLVNWAPNGSIFWTHAFSNISDEIRAFCESDECSYYFGGKRYERAWNKDINTLMLVGVLKRDVQYGDVRLTKKKLKEVEALLKTCQIVDLGWTESRDYRSLRGVSEKMVEMFTIKQDNDLDFLTDNIYKYIDWVVSIYKTITEIDGYQPRMSDPIYSFELEWANHHRFSDSILKQCLADSKTLQVFMYFHKAMSQE